MKHTPYMEESYEIWKVGKITCKYVHRYFPAVLVERGGPNLSLTTLLDINRGVLAIRYIRLPIPFSYSLTNTKANTKAKRSYAAPKFCINFHASYHNALLLGDPLANVAGRLPPVPVYVPL